MGVKSAQLLDAIVIIGNIGKPADQYPFIKSGFDIDAEAADRAEPGNGIAQNNIAGDDLVVNEEDLKNKLKMELN